MYHNSLSVLALLVSYGSAQQLFASGLPDGPPAHIQDCAAGGDYAGAFTDGTGTYIDSDSVRYNIGKKCWNDYIVVTSTQYAGPWYQIGGEIYCTSTENCVSGVTSSKQTCLSVSDQITESIGLEAAGLSVGGSYSHTWTSETCNTDTKNNACTWDDQGCHAIWGQDVMVLLKGYKRERCNTVDGGAADFTNCMSDFEVAYPTGAVNYGCGSKCGDTNTCGNNDGTPCPPSSGAAKRTIPNSLRV